jgi:hypothetical protein
VSHKNISSHNYKKEKKNISRHAKLKFIQVFEKTKNDHIYVDLCVTQEYYVVISKVEIHNDFITT